MWGSSDRSGGVDLRGGRAGTVDMGTKEELAGSTGSGGSDSTKTSEELPPGKEAWCRIRAVAADSLKKGDGPGGIAMLTAAKKDMLL